MDGNSVSSPTPLTPPHSEEERLLWLRLLRSRRVGVTTFHRLLAEHGSAAAALQALPQVAQAAGVKNYQPCPLAVVEQEWANARAKGLSPLFFGEPDYPAHLSQIPDPPPILWLKGRPDLLSGRMIALVGARNASSLGTRMARKLAEDLGAAGFVVVSGLARGIDTAAHLASLDTGTIAVMAGGLDVIYPSENLKLSEDIAAKGLLVSEQPVGLHPTARHFPVRNRIIAGLARATVVVEAAAKSGSLITARTALDQGREVLAVPGHPFDARASGANMLIRDGAVLVRGAEDVIEALTTATTARAPVRTTADVPAAPPETRTLADTAALHSQILARLGPSPLAEDQLIRDLDLPTETVTQGLVTLELDGKITRQPGGLLSVPADA